MRVLRCVASDRESECILRSQSTEANQRCVRPPSDDIRQTGRCCRRIIQILCRRYIRLHLRGQRKATGATRRSIGTTEQARVCSSSNPPSVRRSISLSLSVSVCLCLSVCLSLYVSVCLCCAPLFEDACIPTCTILPIPLSV